MKLVEWVFANRSICRCGFPALNDDVPLGKAYIVNIHSVRGGFTFTCGGCGRVQRDVFVVDAQERNGGFAPLPVGIFEAMHHRKVM